MTGSSFDRGLTVESEGGKKEVGVFLVTSDHFQTLGIPLLQGRAFSESESLEKAPVAIANASAARFFEADGKVLGKHLSTTKEGTYEVIGVVADSRQSLRRPALPAVYLPIVPEKFRAVSVAVRSAGDPGRLVAALQAEIRTLDPNVTFGIKPLDFYLDREVATQRFQTLLFSLFAVLALALTVIGIYGIVSYSVSRRTQEIGIMMALGARAEDIQLWVAREALTLVAMGSVVGLAGALALSRVMKSLLYEITPQDPGTFVGVLSLMIFVALLAGYLSARKATRIDPIVALRQE
jgi:ABC-type antimicrobial peptide transport system permease subunit